MALNAGTRLGPYEIVSLIGAGGMGKEYRPTDTRLKRDVAIKVLPELFAHDLDRLARFTRMANDLWWRRLLTGRLPNRTRSSSSSTSSTICDASRP